jgi:hypothetical protein
MSKTGEIDLILGSEIYATWRRNMKRRKIHPYHCPLQQLHLNSNSHLRCTGHFLVAAEVATLLQDVLMAKITAEHHT